MGRLEADAAGAQVPEQETGSFPLAQTASPTPQKCGTMATVWQVLFGKQPPPRRVMVTEKGQLQTLALQKSQEILRFRR